MNPSHPVVSTWSRRRPPNSIRRSRRIDADARRLKASAGLVRALGGGWHDARS